MSVKNIKKKVCDCGPPYGYAPHVANGSCRFCWGYEPVKKNELKPVPSCWTGAFF